MVELGLEWMVRRRSDLVLNKRRYEQGTWQRPVGRPVADVDRGQAPSCLGQGAALHHTRGLCYLVVWVVAMILVDLLVDWLFLASYRDHRAGTPGPAGH